MSFNLSIFVKDTCFMQDNDNNKIKNIYNTILMEIILIIIIIIQLSIIKK